MFPECYRKRNNSLPKFTLCYQGDTNSLTESNQFINQKRILEVCDALRIT